MFFRVHAYSDERGDSSGIHLPRRDVASVRIAERTICVPGFESDNFRRVNSAENDFGEVAAVLTDHDFP
jgi:hypothetical protein